MVEALAPDRSDEPFDMAILPRRAWCDRVVTDPYGSQSATDDCPVRLVAIPKEIARGLIPGECLGDLARDPFCGQDFRPCSSDKPCRTSHGRTAKGITDYIATMAERGNRVTAQAAYKAVEPGQSQFRPSPGEPPSALADIR